MQADCDLKCRSTQGWDDTHHFAPAADSHILGQRNLRRHNQGQLYGVSFGQRKIGTEKCSPGAQILGDSLSFTLWNERSDGHWKGKAKPLCRSALEMALDSAHSVWKHAKIGFDYANPAACFYTGLLTALPGRWPARETLPQLLTGRKHKLKKMKIKHQRVAEQHP